MSDQAVALILVLLAFIGALAASDLAGKAWDGFKRRRWRAKRERRVYDQIRGMS